MLPRRRSISASVAKANWRSGPRSPMPLLIRPAVMFGPDDAFLTTILKLLGRLPLYPMFGRGLTKLQPAYVEDVAEAIARALQRTETHAITFECGGPRVYTYEELLRAVAHEAKLKSILIPVPFAARHHWLRPRKCSKSSRHSESSGTDAGRHRVIAEIPGFAELGISPHSVEEALRQLWSITDLTSFMRADHLSGLVVLPRPALSVYSEYLSL